MKWGEYRAGSCDVFAGCRVRGRELSCHILTMVRVWICREGLGYRLLLFAVFLFHALSGQAVLKEDYDGRVEILGSV